MRKLDDTRLREELTKAWGSLPVPSDDEGHRQKVLLLKRATPLLVELGVFLSQEMTRNNDHLMQGITNIAEVIATGVSPACENMLDPEPVASSQMNAAHKAIHVFTDTLDRELHAIHYDRARGSGSVIHASVDLPFKEVGDA